MTYKPRKVSWNRSQSDIKTIREKVFVCEYRIAPQQEFDQQDDCCDHVLLRDDQNAPIATGRIDPHGKISRIAILMQHRNLEVANTVIRKLLEIARAKGLTKVYIDSELEEVEKYTSQGFSASGAVFMDAGIAKQTLTCPVEGFTYDHSLLH
jgi:hypothetical protein